MAFANFEEFCKGFCDIACCDAPSVLLPRSDGSFSFSFEQHSVRVTFLAKPQAPGTVFMMAHLGDVPDAHSPEAWLRLLDANLFFAHPRSPKFSRSVRTGRAMMHWACSLEQFSATDVFERASQMIDMACSWRRDYVVRPPSNLGPHQLRALFSTDQRSDASSAAFDALCIELCDLTGLPRPENFLDLAQDKCLLLRVDEGDLLVSRSSGDPDAATLSLPFSIDGSLADGFALELMELNFRLMTDPFGACLCRNPANGDWVMQASCVIAGTPAHEWVAQITRMAHCVRALQHAAARDAALPSSELFSFPASGHPARLAV